MTMKVSAHDYDYDLVIIGAGVGGHGAALHAVAPFRATTNTTTNTDPSDGYDAGPPDDVLRVSVAFNVDC